VNAAFLVVHPHMRAVVPVVIRDVRSVHLILYIGGQRM
jgi:hypothetical protein